MSKSLPDINHLALKSARENRNLSQEQLAKQLCLSTKHIDQLENQTLTVFFSLSHKVQVAKKVARHLAIPLHIALIERNSISSPISENNLTDSSFENSANGCEQLNYNITSQKINELTEISLDIPAQYVPAPKIKNFSKVIFFSSIAALVGAGILSTYLLFDKVHSGQSSAIIESEAPSSQLVNNNEQPQISQTNSVIQPNNETFVPPNSAITNNSLTPNPKASQGN